MWEENTKLAYFLAHKYKGNLEWDDALQCALFGLYKASQTWKEDKGTKFATYASTCVYNELGMYRRKFRNDSKIAYHMEETVDDADNLAYGDMLADVEGDHSEMLCIKEAIKKCQQKYPRKYRAFHLCQLHGISQRDAAQILGLSQSYVSRNVTTCQKYIAKELLL